MRVFTIILSFAGLALLTGCQQINPTTQEEINQLSLQVNDLKETVSVLNEQVETLSLAPANNSVTLQPSSPSYSIETSDPTQPIVEITDIEPASAPAEQNLKSTLANLSQGLPGASTTSKYKGKKYIVISGVSVSDVQLALTNAGYNPGAIDGKIGSRTIGAIKRFQRAERLKVDGVVGRLTWTRLSSHL